MRAVWKLPRQEDLPDTGKDWLLNVLANCDAFMRDCVIMLLWRLWSLRNDLTHGTEAPPIPSTVLYLQSYMQSLDLARRFSTDEIIKGKMPMVQEAPPFGLAAAAG